MPQLVELYLGGEIDVDPFISHRMTLDDVNRGFELMDQQDGIRSVLEASGRAVSGAPDSPAGLRQITISHLDTGVATGAPTPFQ